MEMGRKLIFVLVVLVIGLSSFAHGATIIWVAEATDIDSDGTPDDFAWIPWLESLGYTVDVQRGYWTTLDTTKIAALNAADLIIVSRCSSSGNYNTDAAEIGQWSGITTPIIDLAAHFVRNNRWYWFNSATINNLVGPMMEVVEPGHAIFTGISLDAAQQVAVVDGTTGSGQTSFIGTADPGNGTLLAKTGTSSWIVEWEPGQPFYAGSPQTPAGKRLLFSAGTQEVAPTPIGAFNLTEQGKRMLSNAILYMLGKSVVQGLAADPAPAVGTTDVPFDVTLNWTAGEFAKTHDVYLGIAAADVNNASRADPLGVLVSEGQDGASYATTDLQFGQTYYWRVDEVNAVPSDRIVKGEIWSFTVEPFAYPITDVTATAASAQPGMGPENTVNGSGLNASDQHSIEATQMWMSAGVQPSWIQFEFDQVYQLHELWVWNSNQIIESIVGFGAKDVTIEYSTDGATWTPLANAPEFARATGTPDYTANTIVSFDGVSAKYVRLTINSSWGGLPQAGLAEVRFFQIPVQAREPQPANGAAEVDLEATLNWRPGREATSHQVYFGADPNAVRAGTAPAQTVTVHRYLPDSLDFGRTYYWRVDEAGQAAAYPGDLWSFSTREYEWIDDFESYTDQPGEEIFTVWVDDFTNGLSGSMVGYLTAANGTFGETTIVHAGNQSMPFEYNNVNAPFYSEAEREFSPVQDWTGHGADSLVLYFQGQAPAFLETPAGTIVMGAQGVDIWGNADEFRFAFQPLTGDGSIVARVDSLVQSDVWAKAGVMIRESLEADARNALAYVTPDGRVGWQFRQLLAGTSDSTRSDPGAVTLPHWLRLTRTGSTIKAEHSGDGKTWEPMVELANPTEPTARDFALPATVYIGLAVTSHNAAVSTTAEFSNVTTTGTVAGTWEARAIGAAQPANDPGQLYVVVQDSAGRSKVVNDPDPAATAMSGWQQWRIGYGDLTGVNLAAVKKLYIGVGDRAQPTKGGAGLLYIDDIGYGHPASGY
jgi:hypothetical protein